MKSRKDLYVLAIKEEIKAQDLYKKLRKKIESEPAKDIFSRLIKIEELHEEKVKQLLQEEFPQFVFEYIPDTEMKVVVPESLCKPNDVFLFAIKKEKEAESLYNSLAQDTEDLAVKEMLLRFAEDENNHQKVLDDEINLFAGLLTWFTRDELTGLMEE